MSKVKTPKPCPVCEILKLDESFSNYINTRLKQGVKISEVSTAFIEQNHMVPTEHYIKIHKAKCLKDFVVKNNTPLVEQQIILKQSDTEALNLVDELEKYRNMTFQEKEEAHITRLKEIKYLAAFSIHHQIVFGRSTSKTVPKEDIGALKQIEDILQVLTANSFDREEIPDVNINTYNTTLLNTEILTDYSFPDNEKLENVGFEDDPS